MKTLRKPARPPGPTALPASLRKTIRTAFGKEVGIAPAQPNAYSPTIEKIRKGISLKEFNILAEKLGLTQEDFARKIGISVPTLARRKKANAPLDPEHSDRLIRYQRLFHQAVRLFDGNDLYARDWLNAPEPGLAGNIPLTVAETEAGARDVENVLGRLEYGDLT